MADVFDSKLVKYMCSCGALEPLCYLYFCKYCLKLRCGNCVYHEVDSTFCSGCLEMMSISEAIHKKNRCSSCRVCPCCGHSLSTRATTVQSPSIEDATKLVPKKMYYVACGFCRWTSRDSNLPDQSVASGCWSYHENEHAARLNQLHQTYHALSAYEKAELEKKRYPRPCTTGRYTEAKEKYGYLTVGGRKVTRFSPARGGAPVKEVDSSVLERLAADAEEHVDDYDEQFVTSPPLLTSVTSLEQRLRVVELQPRLCSQLQPLQRQCQLKRSLRCRYCEHNLSKPEYSAVNTKFRIQLNAYYHVPDVKIHRAVVLKPGETTEVLLSFTNPTSHPMTIRLEQYSPPDEDELRESPDPDHREISLMRVVTLQRAEPDMSGTAQLSVSSASFVLAPRDESAEFDEPAPTPADQGNDPAIAWRNGNRMAVRVAVTARGGELRAIAPLLVNYEYTCAIIGANSSSQKNVALRARLMVDFGAVLSVSQ